MPGLILAGLSAQGEPLVQGLYGYGFQTSDEFNYWNVDYNFDTNWSDIFWPYGFEKESGRGWSLKVNGSLLEKGNFSAENRSFNVGWSRKFSAQDYISLEAGVAHGEIRLADQRRQGLNLVGAVKYETHLSDLDLWLRLRISRERTGSQTLQSQGEVGDLYWNHIQPELLWLLSENWRVIYRGDIAEFKDGNQRRSSDGEVLYGFSMDPWIWFGVGGSYLSFGEKKVTYYSPRYFHSYGPRGQTSFSFAGGEWVWSLGGGVNWFREEKSLTSKGHYLLTALQYGIRDGRHLRVFYEDIASSQGGRSWTSRGGGINWIWPF
ncbi:MAG: hypothetical protein KDD43_12795 [Bdellovibrionales bacterium]|nr:hypothetical protein [Bdellovibrionales bacterium]